MIQSEYGWFDETVLDLPVSRLRQITAVIQDRQKVQRVREQTIAEWQTRTLAQFIASTVPADQGGKQISSSADKVKLRLEAEDGKADDDRPIEEVIEKGSVLAENRKGSYEALTAGFG